MKQTPRIQAGNLINPIRLLLQDLPLPPTNAVRGDVLSQHAALSLASSAHVSKLSLLSPHYVSSCTQTLRQAGQETQGCPPASRQALSTGCSSGTAGTSLALDSSSSESLASLAPAACLEIKPKWKGDWEGQRIGLRSRIPICGAVATLTSLRIQEFTSFCFTQNNS